jgi:putative transposase
MDEEKSRMADPPKIYFLTLNCVDGIEIFSRKEYKMVIVDSLNFFIQKKGVEVFAWVLMGNHIHLIIGLKKGLVFPNVIRDLKKFTSREIAAKILEIKEIRKAWLLDVFSREARKNPGADHYKIWTDFNNVLCLQKWEWIEQRLNYIHENPVRQMIVCKPEHYLFSSAADYFNGKGLVDVVPVFENRFSGIPATTLKK